MYPETYYQYRRARRSSDRPGLGIELNEEAAKAHPKADHWLRYYAGTLTDIRPPDSVAYYGC